MSPRAAALAAGMTIAALGLSACDDDDVAAAAGPKTTTQVAAQEIADNTRDDAVPIQINDLPFSDADTDETALPGPV